MKKIVYLILAFSSSIMAQSLSKVYENVSSSVVYIDIVSYDYSKVAFNKMVNTEAASLGSGVLISEDGLIWTASHVIQTAEKITVEFTDGDVYEAEVLLSNTNADIALIKVLGDFKRKKKKVATIGDSDAVSIGDDVFVIGAPHGFKQSLSRGIVSGKYVPDNLSNNFEKVEFLQTDAAINPGNSGGPMFNMKGEVVGVASSIYTMSGGFDGIGFAVSSNVAKKMLSGEKGVWTGMESLLLPQELARLLNVPQKSGLLITHVSSKGTAAKIGLLGGYLPLEIGGRKILLGGDIVLEIAGIKFINEESRYKIQQKLSSIKNGGKVTITILRQGEIRTAEFDKQ